MDLPSEDTTGTVDDLGNRALEVLLGACELSLRSARISVLWGGLVDQDRSTSLKCNSCDRVHRYRRCQLPGGIERARYAKNRIRSA